MPRAFLLFGYVPKNRTNHSAYDTHLVFSNISLRSKCSHISFYFSCDSSRCVEFHGTRRFGNLSVYSLTIFHGIFFAVNCFSYRSLAAILAIGHNSARSNFIVAQLVLTIAFGRGNTRAKLENSVVNIPEQRLAISLAGHCGGVGDLRRWMGGDCAPA